MKKVILTIFLYLISTDAVISAPPIPVSAGNVNPGVQLNRDREILQEREIIRDLNTNRDESDAITNSVERQTEPKAGEISFFLRKIAFAESEVFSQEELNQLAAKYENKEIKIGELSALVNGACRCPDAHHAAPAWGSARGSAAPR